MSGVLSAAVSLLLSRAVLYAEIAIEVDAADGDRAEGVLYEENIAVEVRDAGTLDKPPAGCVVLVAYSPPDEAAGHAARITSLLREGGVEARLSRLVRDDGTWLDTWKAYFKARPVGPFVIVPSWERHETRNGVTRIDLDPGRAFGTGGHESTRLCLELIGRTPGIDRFLDVGCGSGILAIACALRWPNASGVAVDVDPEAVATTRENLDKNGVAARVATGVASVSSSDSWPGDATERFDLVLANLSAEVLTSLAPHLCARVAPEGQLVASGILIEQGEQVEAAMGAAGLVRYVRLVEGEWVAFGFEVAH